jgi:hypothetical protein
MKKILASIFIGIICGCAQQKLNGISFVASNTPINTETIQPVINLNANWVTLMPFGFMKTQKDTIISYNSKKQWWGETTEGITESVKIFKSKNIKVMLKPQIWIPNGGFTGHINMDTNADWQKLEWQYEKFILEFAILAQKTNCEMFCIGTELNTFVENRPVFWEKLIQKIRLIYSGKLTYAENWDTYKNVNFWKQLDYIGIDAYFPISDEKNPIKQTLLKNWKPLKKEIMALAKENNKPILFTEFGYQSKDYTAKEPWNYNLPKEINLEAQTIALESIFETFWEEPWFAGGFLWKWYDKENAGGLKNTDYTIQNKPAEKLVKERYGRF